MLSMELSGSVDSNTACLLTCKSLSAAACWKVLRGGADNCQLLPAVPPAVLLFVQRGAVCAELHAVSTATGRVTS